MSLENQKDTFFSTEYPTTSITGDGKITPDALS